MKLDFTFSKMVLVVVTYKTNRYLTSVDIPQDFEEHGETEYEGEYYKLKEVECGPSIINSVKYSFMKNVLHYAYYDIVLFPDWKNYMIEYMKHYDELEVNFLKSEEFIPLWYFPSLLDS